MSSLPIKIAVRYIGRWSGIVFFVVLLTVIFSFLGTIICAVLAGMMMGATKHPRWQAIPVGIVFPAVIFTLLRSTKAELLGRQVMVLSLLCFGAFWLTYVVTTLLILYERRQPQLAEGPPVSSPVEAPMPANLSVTRVASTRPLPTATLEPLSLADLQGEWNSTNVAHNGDAHQKTLQIRGDKLVLSIRDSGGRLRPLAEGELKIQERESAQRLNAPQEGHVM